MAQSRKSGTAVPDPASPERPRIAVSSCLLGEPVRWDGDHKREPFIAEALGARLTLVPVCPEVAVGLGVPRDPLRLEGDPREPRARELQGNRRDLTDLLSAYGRRMAVELEGISGYVFKSGSPSCGLMNVPVHGHGSRRPDREGTGIFAREIVAALPLLPVEEEHRLRDPVVREIFIKRVFAYSRLR